jgi:hypothetical protein
MNQGEINAALVSLDSREISRFIYRVGLFRRRGLSERNADYIADRLALRDQQSDHRRMCIECSHLQQRGTCFAAASGAMRGVDRRLEPVKLVLQRCPNFSWQKPT